MYCEEPIIRVWYLESMIEKPDHWAYTDYYHDFVYYVSDGIWMVFQTENHFITIGADGVKTWQSKDEFLTPDLDFYNDAYWNLENTDDTQDTGIAACADDLYYQGERIHNVTEKDDGWLIEFDHFSLMVHPRTEKNQPWSSYVNYIPFKNLNHKLKRCSCGGEAQLFVDHVYDYVIRCASCHKSTYADYSIESKVNSWNSDDCPVRNHLFPIESFMEKKDQTIRNIFIRKEAKQITPNIISCDQPLLQFDDTAFPLTYLTFPGYRCSLHIRHETSGFNPEMWPTTIELTDEEDGFHFVSLIREGDHDVMTLTTGKRDIVITAMPDHIDIRIINTDKATDQEKEEEP